MNILIERIPNTYNYGSFMMAINTIYNINKQMKDVKFWTDVLLEEDLDRLKMDTGINNIYKYEKVNFEGNKIKKYINMRRYYRDNYDAIIILGGDDISEYYSINSLMYRLKKMYLNTLMGVKVILLGQTIGPFTGKRVFISKIVLNRTRIYVRDVKCLDYLEKIGIKNVIDGRDLAFLDLPRKGTDILERYGLVSNEYITIVASGLYKWYTSDYDTYIQEYISIIEGLLESERIKGKKIVLLAHVLKPDKVDDRKVIVDLQKKLNKWDGKIVYITEKLLASEAREILINGFFTISGRMHAAVSTFYGRKPAISLSYSVKYEGVIGRGLGRNDLIIESSGEEYWRNNYISNMVYKKVCYVVDNYDKLVKEIDEKVESVEKIVKCEIDDVVRYLNNCTD